MGVDKLMIDVDHGGPPRLRGARREERVRDAGEAERAAQRDAA